MLPRGWLQALSWCELLGFVKHAHKVAVKAFIVKRLMEVTCEELANAAFEAGGSPFEFAEYFGNEMERIEGFLKFPLD